MRYFTILLLLASLAVTSFADSNPWKGNWIWNTTPRANNYFRKVIVASDQPVQAKIAITVDNIYDLYVNGHKVGSDDNWMSLEVYDVTKYVTKGPNIIAVKGIDTGTVSALLLEGAFTYANGRATVFGTDKTWKITGTEYPNWATLNLNDSDWQAPRVIGKPPMGPWEGINYPVLTPKTPLRTISVDWPKDVKQGETFNVTAKVNPDIDIAFDSPVALRIVINNQAAYEQWIDPKVPTTSWKPGETRTLEFKNFRVPLYIPSDKVQLQVATNATESVGAIDVIIGKPKVTPALKLARMDFSIKNTAISKKVTVNISAPAAPKNANFLLALYKGPEMWYTANISSGKSSIQLPEGFPGGSYAVKVLPHKMRCAYSPTRSINIAGSVKTTLKPLGYGTYVDCNQMPHRWYVNAHGAMIWDGKPYIPIGAMFLSRFLHDYQLNATTENEKKFKEDIQLLSKLKSVGVTDVYLNPCARWQDKPVWVWQRWADICEQVGMNYGIQITNQVKPVRAFNIAQDEYMVAIKGGETAKASVASTIGSHPMPDGTVYYAAFDAETNEVLDTGKAAVTTTNLGTDVEATPKVASGKEINVHFIPEFEYNDGLGDYWQRMGDYKQWSNEFFTKLKLGPNFRIWIDPLDNEQSLRDAPHMIPNSKVYRSMFADYLKQHYSTTSALASAWAISGLDSTDFSVFARLLPLGKPNKDSSFGYTFDEETGATYKVDLTQSSMWYDMVYFRDSSVAHFNSVAADIVKSIINAPVVLKGTDSNFFTNLRTHGGFDGVGMEAYGSAPELVRGCGGGVYSRCKQSNRTMWTLSTETGLGDEFCGYPDPIRLTKELGSMLEMNGKGTYYFVLGAPSASGWSIFNLFDDPRQLTWMGAYAKLAKNSTKLANYEPDVDYYFPGKLAGQDDGFVAYNDDFYGERPSQSVAGDSGKWIVTTATQIPADAKRLIVNLENDPATGIYGATLEQSIKSREVVVVGHRKNLGALSIDSYYTNKFVKDADGVTVQALVPTPTSTVFAKLEDGTVYGLTDGNLTLYSRDDWIKAARKMAGKPQDIDFYKDVLGLNVLDLGPAFQAMHFGSTTYIWNMQGNDNALTLNVPESANNVLIRFADGTSKKISGAAEIALPVPANASKPVIIENLADVNILGIDKANIAAAMQKWAVACDKAKSLGITTNVMPGTDDWHEIYKLADDLLNKADETYRTTTAAYMPNVKVDGDISEWSKLSPIYTSLSVNVDYAASEDYNGAKFYIGYDNNYIYVAGDVNDEAIVNNYRLDSLWNGDGVEVFIDLYPYAEPTRTDYNTDSFQFLFAPTDKDGKPGMVIKNPKLPGDSVPQHSLWAVKKRTGGWQFETAINKADINSYNIQPNGKIGFTLQLDDSDGGDRTTTRLWRGRKDTSRNRLAFGRLVFSPAQ